MNISRPILGEFATFAGCSPIILGVSDRDDERSDYAQALYEVRRVLSVLSTELGRNQQMQRRQHQTENTRSD
jgi:hypothetical protein